MRTVPISLANLFRAVVVCLLAVHVFYMYSIARAMHSDFGFDPGTSLLAAVFSLVMLVPLIWAVTLPEWPEVYARHVRARRWFRNGRCATCGYRHVTQHSVCSECGSAYVAPPPYVVSWQTVRMFAIVNLLAWALGSVAGEVWASDDERDFVREVGAHVQAGNDNNYSRSRRWPASSSTLVYDVDQQEFTATRTYQQ